MFFVAHETLGVLVYYPAMKVTIDVKPEARQRIGQKLSQPKPSNDQMRGFIERATRASLDSDIRRFLLMRKTDVSGVSGTGIVAEGVRFANGKVVVSWRTKYTSVVVFDDIETAEAIHCHGGMSEIVWQDE